MTHAERLRAIADGYRLAMMGDLPAGVRQAYEADLIPALEAGAAALDALTPRRITSDPATWPPERSDCLVWLAEWRVAQYHRGDWYIGNGCWRSAVSAPIWMPIPPKPEGE